MLAEKSFRELRRFAPALLLLCYSVTAVAQQHKVVFVIADGIPADVIERLKPPALEAIRKEGGYARTYVGGEKGRYSQTPTISAVGYNSLLTGTWVHKHNVWDNDIIAPNYAYWNLFRLLKNEYPEKTTAVFSTWLDNRTKLVGSASEAAGHLQPDYHFDGMELDTTAYPHDTAGYFYHRIDNAVADTAAAYIRRQAPDLSWVYLEYTDEVGHRRGTGPAQDDAVMKMDRQIATLWEAVRYRQKTFGEDWQIWITTDHGRDAFTGRNHGGQSERERTTWIYTNARNLNRRFTSNGAAIVDLMPSMAAFLNLHIPRERMMEIDGVPLTGKLSASDAQAALEGNRLRISWKVIDPSGKARIYVATTNLFNKGGTDAYTLMGTVPVAGGAALIDVSRLPSAFYKIAIVFPYNDLNRWVSRETAVAPE